MSGHFKFVLFWAVALAYIAAAVGVVATPSGAVITDDGTTTDVSTTTATVTGICRVGSDSRIGSGPMLASYMDACVVGNSTATTIADQGAWVEASAGGGAVVVASRDCSLIDTSTLGFSWDGANERMFQITVALITTVGGANLDVGWRIAVNDTTDANSQVSRSHSSANDVGSVSLVFMATLQPGDEASLYTANLDSAADVTIQDAHMAAVGFQ